ncbi:methyl-accepting chemotaxis protein [Neptuniibacter sp. PT34_22]|uniref:methyl-accepting chemotaxis protein n=1 Tax=Neptuniibacter sp. PT34_22 TaxID=3398205 RepID=UPI0039F4B0F1
MLQSQLDAILRRISAASNEVQTSASESTEVMDTTCREAEEQQRSLQQLAAAMSQVSCATSSVAQTTAEALQQVHQVQDDTNHGGVIVDSAVNAMTSLDQAINQIDHNIDNLKQSSENIGKVVVVISDIAEQTNLLALNAAIEAARAGENGRGFAVVADEVRQLAQRTQNSTQEINDIITALQQEITLISGSMVNGRELTDTSVLKIQEAGSSLKAILTAVDELSNMTAQIASATEQQNAVAVEMNEQIFTIQRNSENVVSQASQTLNLNKKSEDLARKQSQMIERFLTC